MKKILILLITSLIFGACGASKNATKKNTKTDKIVSNALKYKGVKYKYGGTTKRGMDCSGVVYVAFGKENVQLPRISKDMAKRGKKISLRRAKKGDLLFFKISRRKKRINHVGLVTSVKNGQVMFIHATSSRGVIVSSMSEKYWKNSFVKATRVL
ncbi:C40 family peptidase [Polaribacter litorisediminis]|uniref:C40 family peptidase n=1 Tax=Polaribacter litorisediminis TaxID=1908341 RepID=UPI001CBED231|nr:C40 family peptidase [Polaribacter litorisediminis]UAM98702.1 C40 family peptidase [Polaribacter litorisediminis]